MVAGDNGIFSRARLAKESYENAALKEAADLNSLDGWISGKIDNLDNGDEDEDGGNGTSAFSVSEEEYREMLEAMQIQSNTIKDLQTQVSSIDTTVKTQGNTINDSILNTDSWNSLVSSSYAYRGISGKTSLVASGVTDTIKVYGKSSGNQVYGSYTQEKGEYYDKCVLSSTSNEITFKQAGYYSISYSENCTEWSGSSSSYVMSNHNTTADMVEPTNGSWGSQSGTGSKSRWLVIFAEPGEKISFSYYIYNSSSSSSYISGYGNYYIYYYHQ